MHSPLFTRRDAVRIVGVATATAMFNGLGESQPVSAATMSADQLLVDVHLHLVSSRLSRRSASTPPPPPFDLLLQPGGAERLGKQVTEELRAARVEHALCMPTAIVSDDDPLGIKPTVGQMNNVAGVKLHPVGAVHPERFDEAHLERVDEELSRGRVKALKTYLGYFHYPATHPGYRPYFRLAAKHNVPVIFHTGDTYSPTAKVKFAHPLQVDEIAVDFPDTQFVLAHFGNPWILDAAQVVYKNKNVWVDLSAILIGDASTFLAMKQHGTLERTGQRLREGIEYSEAPERFMFGSDWPLSSIAAYRDFVAELFPREHLPGVLHDNAVRLFRLK